MRPTSDPTGNLPLNARAAGGLIAAIVFVAAYVLLDWLSYVQPILKLGITPWNPQTGLAVAFLILFGSRWVPAVAIAACAAEILVRGIPSQPLVTVTACLLIACTYGALAHSMGRQAVEEATQTLPAAARLAALSVLAALAAALGYVLLFVLAGLLPKASTLSSIARYWVGDINGILTLTPLTFIGRNWRQLLAQLRSRKTELLSQVALIAVMVWLIFGLDAADQVRFFYPLFVPVVWIAIRWGAAGALLATLAIQIGVVLAVRDAYPGVPLLDLQFLMLTLSLTGLFLGAAVQERVTAQARAAAGEAELRALLATAPDAVITVSNDLKIQSANTVALQIFELDAAEQPAVSLSSLIPQITALNEKGRATAEAHTTNGRDFPAEVAWVRLEPPARQGWLLIARDVSERRRAEAQTRERDSLLARSLRFAVAGELASALTHELNQPITALVSYLQALEILVAPVADRDARLDETLNKAAAEAVRAARVLQRLRDFYIGGSMLAEEIDLRECCRSAAGALADRLRANGIALRLSFGEQAPRVIGDATQIEIVLHNLLSNAVDAISSASSTTKVIALSIAVTAESIELVVADSGPGVPTAQVSQLFTAFHTSKSDGMGLGLALSRSLLRAQNAELQFAPSTRWGGASFSIRWPIDRLLP